MIREACLLDCPRLMQLGADYLEETGMSDKYPLDYEHATTVFNTYMSNDRHIVLLAVRGSEVIGFFVGSLAYVPWSPVRIAMDNLLYIQPRHRGRAYGVQLIKRYEAWARSLGCTEIQISIASGITEDRTCGLYQRMGFDPSGRQFRKEI